MIDFVLVQARCDRSGKPGRIEHVGLGYLASMLRTDGRRVRVIDAEFHRIDAGEVARLLLAEPSRAAGFSVFLTNIGETLKIISLLRAAGDPRHVTLGGHHATFNHQDILARVPEVDSVVLGEGELPALHLAQRLAGGQDWADVPGIAFRNAHDNVVANPLPPLLPDLDRLPFPDREPYVEMMRDEGRASILSSRGCYGACSFCSIRAFYGLSYGQPWRGRSAQSVVDEIEDVVRRYGVKHIEFLDDNLIGAGRRGAERARALGEEILRRGLQIEFFFVCRANDVDAELFRFLKRAGLKGVDIGVESFVPRQLALYNKRISVEENRRAIEVLKSLDLVSRFYLIPSDPYVTPDELLRNLAEAELTGLQYFFDSAIFNRLTVFKGSPIEEQVRRDGLLCPLRTGSSYNGALECRFVHKEMAQIHAIGDAIYREHIALMCRLEQTFSSPECHSLEREVCRQLALALRQAVFALFKASIEACRRGDLPEEPAVPPCVPETLQALAREVSVIVSAHEEGAFHRFADLELKLGGFILKYPPQFVQQLVQQLWAG